MTEPWREGEVPPIMARPNWPLCGLAGPGDSLRRPADLASIGMAGPADGRNDPVSAAL